MQSSAAFKKASNSTLHRAEKLYLVWNENETILPCDIRNPSVARVHALLFLETNFKGKSVLNSP